MKKTQKYSTYEIDNNNTQNIVSEPSVSYNMPSTNTPAGHIISMMGMSGKKEYATIKDDNDFINVIRTGLPRQAMTSIMSIADISLLEMASITHTSDRTLRRYKPQQKLSEEQSERMIELAKLYTIGAVIFGNMEQFKQWMDTTLLTFGNKKPKEFLDTSMGIKMIMEEIGRIQHGIFA